MKYIIVQDYSTERLEKLVEKYLKAGYAPQGGVAVAAADSGMIRMYTQAMIFVEEPK